MLTILSRKQCEIMVMLETELLFQNKYCQIYKNVLIDYSILQSYLCKFQYRKVDAVLSEYFWYQKDYIHSVWCIDLI